MKIQWINNRSRSTKLIQNFSDNSQVALSLSILSHSINARFRSYSIWKQWATRRALCAADDDDDDVRINLFCFFFLFWTLTHFHTQSTLIASLWQLGKLVRIGKLYSLIDPFNSFPPEHLTTITSFQLNQSNVVAHFDQKFQDMVSAGLQHTFNK